MGLFRTFPPFCCKMTSEHEGGLMDFEKLIKSVIDTLKESKKFKQVEEYDGQFEILEKISAFPPAAFVDIEGDTNEGQTQISEDVTLSIRLFCSKLMGQVSGIYALRAYCLTLNGLAVKYKDEYIGRMHYQSSEQHVNLPGAKTWKINFSVR